MNLREGLLRATALAGLAVSCALAVDYLSPADAAVCSAHGCAAVRDSAWAHPLGVPLPVVGVGYFAALLVAMTRARRWLRPLAVAGGVGAAGFVAVQALVVGAFCPLCLIVDGAAIAVAALSFAVAREPRVSARWFVVDASVAALAVATATMLAGPGARVATSELPAPVAAEQREGVATIVKFADFRCPHCRELHHRLQPLLAEYGDAVRLVLRPGLMSRASIPAATTYCCAELLDPARASAVADALFTAERLGPADCLDIGVAAGLPREELATCMTSPEAADRLSTHLAANAEAEVRGFPTTWIGAARFEGALPVDELRALIAQAIAGG